MPGWFWKYVPYFPTDLGAEIFGSPFICVLLSLRHRLEGRNCLLSPLTEALTTQISPIPASAASSPSTMGLPSPSFTPPWASQTDFRTSAFRAKASWHCFNASGDAEGAVVPRVPRLGLKKTGPIPWQGAPRLLQLLVAVVEERPVLQGENMLWGAYGCIHT